MADKKRVNRLVKKTSSVLGRPVFHLGYHCPFSHTSWSLFSFSRYYGVESKREDPNTKIQVHEKTLGEPNEGRNSKRPGKTGERNHKGETRSRVSYRVTFSK